MYFLKFRTRSLTTIYPLSRSSTLVLYKILELLNVLKMFGPEPTRSTHKTTMKTISFHVQLKIKNVARALSSMTAVKYYKAFGKPYFFRLKINP